MEEKAARVIFTILIFGFSFYGTVALNLGGDPFSLGAGYSVVWLLFLYFIGASIKKYEWDKRIIQKYQYNKIILTFLICAVLTSAWYLVLNTVTLKIMGVACWGTVLLSYISPTMLCMALCLLILFANYEVKNSVRSVIRIVAPGTFAVYLLHEQPVLRKVLKQQFGIIKNLNGLWSVIVILGCALVIFAIGILVDCVRRKLFEICKMKKFAQKIDILIWKIINIFSCKNISDIQQ